MTVTYSRIFVRRNSTHPQSINTPIFNETKIFGDCFYFPIVKAIRSGIKDHRSLKTIVADFVKSLDDDDVNYCFNNYPETLLVHSPVSTELEENTGRKKKIVKPMHLIPESETSFYSANSVL